MYWVGLLLINHCKQIRGENTRNTHCKNGRSYEVLLIFKIIPLFGGYLTKSIYYSNIVFLITFLSEQCHSFFNYVYFIDYAIVL